MDNPDVIDTLNGLIETCKDSEQDFRSRARSAAREDLRQLFTSRADDYRRAAIELQTLVLRQGGRAEGSGTTAATLQRGWAVLKIRLGGGSDIAWLAECERGEDHVLDRYRGALADDLPSETMPTLRRQFNDLKQNRSLFRLLREEALAAAAHA